VKTGRRREATMRRVEESGEWKKIHEAWSNFCHRPQQRVWWGIASGGRIVRRSLSN
jgi:hypothetical protein